MTWGIRIIEFERTVCAGAYERKNREVALKLATYRFCNFCLIIFFSSAMEWFICNCYPILLPSIGGTNACEKLAEYMGIKSELQQFIVLFFHSSDIRSPLHQSWNEPFRYTSDDLAVMRQSNRDPTIISTVTQKARLTYLCVKDTYYLSNILSVSCVGQLF